MSVNYNSTAVNRGLLLSCDFANPKNYSKLENLIASSENFSHSFWGSSTVNILSSTETDPLGTNTATLIQAKRQNYGGFLRNSSTSYKTFTTYTISVYAKAGTWNLIGLRCGGDIVSNDGADRYTYFNLSTGTTTIVTPTRFSSVVLSAGMIPVGNGWYRCYLTATTGSRGFAGDSTDISIVDSNGGTPGNGSSLFRGDETVYVWGAMLERSNTLGSYIKTTGTASVASILVDPISGLTGSLNNTQYYSYDSSTNSMNFDRSSTTIIGGFAQFLGTGNLTANNFLYNDHTMEIFAKINDFNGSDINTNQHSNSLFTYQGYHSGIIYEYTGGNNVIFHGLWNGTGWYTTYVPNNSISAGQWFHLVQTRSGNITTLYLNGVSVATQTYSTSLGNPGTSDYIKIGSANPVGLDFAFHTKMNCSIARLYNVALTASEILQNFNTFRGRGGI